MKSMWYVMILLVLSTVSANAVYITEGVRELRAGGSYQFASEDGPALDLNLGLGLFVFDGIYVGVIGGLGDSDSVRRYDAGLAFEYNYDSGTVLIPYIGLSVGWSKSRLLIPDHQGTSQRESTDSLLTGVGPGVKYFFAENLAISFSYVWEWANEDVFLDRNKPKNTNHSLQLGMRFYF